MFAVRLIPAVSDIVGATGLSAALWGFCSVSVDKIITALIFF